MGVTKASDLQPMVEDPDDYRPGSRWCLVTDPGGPGNARVDGLPLIFEEIGVGDRIPLHRHPVDEAVVFTAGSAEVRLGDETHEAGAGTVVFIPAGVAHGTTNVGRTPVRIQAVFPSHIVGIEMLERNPAPGTDDKAPSNVEYNLRTGEFTELGPSNLRRPKEGP